MIKTFLASVTVLSILLFSSCSPRQDSAQGLQDKGELVVAMDIDLPGFFTLGDEHFGYQYELLKAYAEHRGLPLRIIEGSTEDAHQLMKENKADIVAELVPQLDNDPNALLLYNTSYVILTGKDAARKFGQTKPFSLIKELSSKRLAISSGFKTSKSYDLLMDSLRGDIFVSTDNPMERIESLSEGKYDFLICEKSEAQLGSTLMKNICEVYAFSEKIPVGITMSPNIQGLREDFMGWLENYRNGEDYAMLGCLYFDKGTVGQLIARTTEDKKGGISIFDDIIREVSEREGHDWRLMSAIAYNESRFNPYIVSNRGAKGLMQIMPAVARQFQIGEQDLMNPEINVMLAAKVLSKIERSLHIAPGTPFVDRMSIILACYNGGIGHVLDARRLAAKYGGNPDSWADVSLFLQKKADPAYHQDDVVKCGSFTGSGQTLAFVSNVMSKYSVYCATIKR